jgi:hypothetical protein
MKFLKELFEMAPQRVSPVTWNLDKPEVNARWAKDILDTRDKHAIPYHSKNLTLYELKASYALIDNNDSKLVYVMEYKLENVRFIQMTCASQLKVWRDATELASEGVTKLVFGHLLSKYGAIITDSMQTADGQRFWDNRIAHALEHNFVYYVNLDTKELIKLDKKEYKQMKLDKKIWGANKKYRDRRVVISDKEIDL